MDDTHGPPSPHDLPSGLREDLAELAVCSEVSAEVGEALDELGRRLDSLIIRNPHLAQAARTLKSKIAQWRRAHDVLAHRVMHHANRYEDVMMEVSSLAKRPDN